MTLPVATIVLEGLPFPAAVLDRQGRIVAANAELDRLAPASIVATLVGRRFYEAFDFLPGVAERGSFLGAEGQDTRFMTRLPGTEGQAGPVARLFQRRLTERSEPLALVVLEPLPDELETAGLLVELERRLLEARDVKHEISNVLMGVMGTAELMQRDAGLPAGVRERSAKILAECVRIRDSLSRLARICRSE